jgi:hypothetical protein
MDEFSKIQEQIDKLGGVQTATNDEGYTANGVYVPYTDPESGATGRRFVPVESLFATSVTEEGGSNGAENYKLYQDTMAALDRGADQLKIDKSAFATPSELFKAINDKADNLYIVTGRANNWDKDVADRAGITGVGKDRGGINHATVLYQKVGDKLMPLETLKTFNFDDPNTTRGFIGDIAGGVASILSLPPIQLALAFAGGLPNVLANMAGYTGGASALASTLGSSILGETASAASKQLLGNVLLNAGTSGLMTGLATGDLEQAGKAFLSAGAGTGIAGLSAPYVQNLLGEFVNDPKLLSQLTKVGSETLGGAASSALSGRDIGDYLRNRLFSTGIGALMGTAGSEAKSKLNVSDDTVNMIKAFAPIVTSRRVTPDDIVRIARALEKSNIGQA